MKAPLFSLRPGLALAALLALTTTSSLAAATLTQQMDPQEAGVGDEVTITLKVEGGDIKTKDTATGIFGMNMAGPDITLPQVEGLRWNPNYQFQTISINGKASATVTFTVTPLHTGDFTVPAFDVPLQEGAALQTKAMKLHVVAGTTSPPATVPMPVPINPPSPIQNLPGFNPNGPVVMPPNTPPAPGAADSTSNGTVEVPTESDGRPAKVFVVITPKTTDAYVGESVPMMIDFYIRLDVIAQQDSLPTIKGSDFMMNSLSVHPQENDLMILNEAFHRERWVTAIAAPKSGDFPMQMERDTYWNKPNTTNNNDPFGNFFNRPNLVHELVPSNELTFHVHALPADGRPANFSGAIGHLKVTGAAQPTSVAVGEPVTLHFTVAGEGNFDYVKCPTLADDPAWKTYVPASKTNYQDESHTAGFKIFEQAVIPQKNGTLPLPQASFSYFDPANKQYVTTPINLPAVTVTGTAAAVPPASPGGDADATAAAAKATDFLSNRLNIGSLTASLAPVYRQPWFWVVQGVVVVLLLLGMLFLFFRSRTSPDNDLAERAQRQQTLEQEEDAMGEAVRLGDARAFFLAARHAVQLQLGAQWKLQPEAITLGEIRQRDPQLAETLESLFTQADEVIYSGQARKDLDLAQWQLHVRRDLLQPQPA